MPGIEWLDLLCKHVPDRHEHMVRYYGRYSSRTRAAERERPEIEEPDAESASQARQAAKVAWAKLIRKVYEVDPLLCPKCGAHMRAIQTAAGLRTFPVPDIAWGLHERCSLSLPCRARSRGQDRS